MTTISKEQYSIQRQTISNWLNNKPNADVRFEITLIALTTNCPIIIVTEFVMEIKGRTPELLAAQKLFMEFYNIDEVV